MSPPPSPTATTTTTATTTNIPPPTTTTASLSASKGQIHLKLISARGLNVRNLHARPYVVVQFEQNEFVSRDPTDERDREVKGIATAISSLSCSPTSPSISRDSSSSALSALGAIHAKANAQKGSKPLFSKNNSSTSLHVHPPCAKSEPSSTRTSSTSSASSSASTGATSISGGPFGLGLFGRLSPNNPVWKHEVSFDVTSEDSTITFNVYDRAAVDQGFLGTVQIKPVLAHEHTVDHWYKLKPYADEVVTGEMRVQITYEAYKTKRSLTPRDFEFLKLIGRGTFGKVFQVRKKDTKRIYAMKVLSKKEIIAKKEVAHTIGERKILQYSLSCPFLVGLKFSFQTPLDLYLVTDFKSGGELFWHLQRLTRFSESLSRFYISELVLALEHLHKFGIIYRDLKPENVLLDATGHLALCDFGLSKVGLEEGALTSTFCGTTEYLAPEILLDEKGYGRGVDWWSLGVLLFEMCCGWSPFYAEDTQAMYHNICFGKIRFPKGVIGDDGKNFVKGLLNRNPKHRLGAIRDAAELKEHPFLKSVDWHALALKQVTPPFKPVVESDESTNNFDPEFTEADIRDPKVVGMFLDDEDDFEEERYGRHPNGVSNGSLVGVEESKSQIYEPQRGESIGSDAGKEWLDEDDPSEDWVTQYEKDRNNGHHTPNGPLGWELNTSKTLTPLSPLSATLPPSIVTAPKTMGGISGLVASMAALSAAGTPTTQSSSSVTPTTGESLAPTPAATPGAPPRSANIQITTTGARGRNDYHDSDSFADASAWAKRSSEKVRREKEREAMAGTPLTRSVQENFRGFTYHGGESLVERNMREHAERRAKQANDEEKAARSARGSESSENHNGVTFGNGVGRGRVKWAEDDDVDFGDF